MFPSILYIKPLNFIRCFTASEIPLRFIFNRKIRFIHAVGVVVGNRTKIANGVQISSCVTLGHKSITNKQMPTIESNVYIGSGARVLGNVTIGHDSVIGANAVITKDVQPYSTVVGYNIVINKSINKNEGGK